MIESPAKVLDLWTSELDALAIGRHVHRHRAPVPVWAAVAGGHAGAPGRAPSARGDLWMASLAEVAERAHQTIAAGEQRPVPVCTIAEDVYGKRFAEIPVE